MPRLRRPPGRILRPGGKSNATTGSPDNPLRHRAPFQAALHPAARTESSKQTRLTASRPARTSWRKALSPVCANPPGRPAPAGANAQLKAQTDAFSRNRGLQVKENTPPLVLHRRGRRVSGVASPRGRVPARRPGSLTQPVRGGCSSSRSLPRPPGSNLRRVGRVHAPTSLPRARNLFSFGPATGTRCEGGPPRRRPSQPRTTRRLFVEPVFISPSGMKLASRRWPLSSMNATPDSLRSGFSIVTSKRPPR